MKLSIITVNLNDSNGLEKTIVSVIAQTFKDYEFIIIDGASTDNSVEIIDKYKDSVNYWISEKDNGIYHAMNKGIRKSNGEYCLFLNSGDYLFNNNTLMDVFQNQDNIFDIIYGNFYFNQLDKTWLNRFPKELSLFFFLTKSLCHQSSFIKRTLFDNIGLYSEKYDLVSDWEFFLKVYLSKKYTFKHIEQPVSVYNTYGKSLNPENLKKGDEERSSIAKSYFDPEIIQVINEYVSLQKKYDLIVNSKFFFIYKVLYHNPIYKFIKYRLV